MNIVLTRHHDFDVIPLTQKRLKELLDYEPVTGLFTWKDSRGGARRGAEAGCKHRNGRTCYREIMVDGKTYKAHRLAYLWMTGKMPPEGTDSAHNDQNGLNNRWGNLRLVSHRENMKNQRLHNTNTSGAIGVSWHKHTKKWRARITLHDKLIYLGIFTDKADAIATRKAAEKRHGFHALHGSA